ncbi:aminoglycoside phosphotransferase family protein [Amnibacterium sp. CER49]|uniref:aminoglycoside phosphotransferase family protein n=1 Tax=Amnibacterium sp. CER49 TaxID=3039161 RepID=UPI00244CC11C|nr:aminoglycoside phosphotransferase family protein [Amnibacterium sp. CER49]MDH2443585.1 aminoglycoside phosphotransferase family protein [Amnibacterium sp. CER49]
MSPRAVPVPAVVRRRAEALGETGEHWLAALDGLVHDIATRWSLEVGEPIPGAGASVVLRVRAGDRDAVLKLEVPEGGTAGQGALLERAAGHGYALLLARDPVRRVLLLERLGAPLGRHGLPAERELTVLADLCRAAWLPPRGEPGSSAAKAAELGAFVEEAGSAADRRVVDAALRCAGRRAGFRGEEVVVHGDPHPGNPLEAARAGAVSGYLLIDPDGFVADPAYDLGVVLRERGADAELPVATLQGWCRLLAERSGLDAQAIWEWAFVERVSTGLLLLRLGDDRGAAWLRSAAHLLDTLS